MNSKINRYSQILLMFFLISTYLTASDFPLRSQFPNVKTISTEELAEGLNQNTLFLIDARNSVEYEAIHIKGAVNIKFGTVSFDDELNKLTKGDKNATVVFYCNGGYCKKSFRATMRATELGYKNAYSYDAGPFIWAETYPNRTYSMGKIINSVADLISSEKFSSKLLPKEEFEQQCVKSNAMLFDVRDPNQRNETPPFKTKIRKAKMDKFVKLLQQKYFKDKTKGKTLYIFDAVGKQVRWLQYYLEEYGYDYFFLKDGVKAYK